MVHHSYFTRLIDNHCHFEQLTEQEQATAVKQFDIIGVASNLAGCHHLLALSRHFSSLSICLGIHPEQIENYHQIDQVVKLIKENRDKIVGIGEIGLPYFSLRKLSSSDRREKFTQGFALFTQFIELASQLSLPVNLHCVGDETAHAITCLQQNKIQRAIFHWFAGNTHLIQKIVDNGWYISISPEVIHNKSYQAVIKNIPLSALCFESDGPWLYQGERGVPNMILAVATVLAELHQKPLEAILEIHQGNSQKLWFS